jgi:hypothetical protein
MQPPAIRFRQIHFGNFKFEISNLRSDLQMVPFSLSHRPASAKASARHFSAWRKMVGVTGLEPVTPRLSSACSNQLSYTPWRAKPASQISNLKFEIQKVGGAEETRTPDL